MADMSVEQPTPTPKEAKIAERWMRMKGIQKPEESKPGGGGLFGKVTEAFKRPASTENPTQLVGEAYDLFVEKQALQDDIARRQREVMEPTSTNPTLTLDQKRELIKQGKIGAILQSVSTAEPFGEVVARSQTRTKEVETRLDQIFSTPGMFEKFHEDLSHQVRVRHQAGEVRSLDRFTEQADVVAVKLTREAQVQGRTLTSVERQFIEDNQALKRDTAERRQALLKDPETFDRVRIVDLQEYQRQLRKDRFAETPSRKRYLKKIEQAWAEAKKVLLTGHTGTGKTEMIKHASIALFGEGPEVVRGNEDTNQYDIIGRVGLDVSKGDVRRPGSMIAAMVARAGRGKPVLIDEMDRIPTKQAMAPKELYNIRPGQKGVKPYSDGEAIIDVGTDYAVGATGNIKSEKHETAQELDAAIVRVFDAPMDVDYMPAPEVYDLALASLMDGRGGIPLSESDARAVLKNLCDAASWIQDAYQGRQVVTDPASGTTLEARGQAATGKAASLKKALLDPGRTVDMLNGWTAAQVGGTSFEAFLNERIVDFINNRAYPDDDRYYLTEIFALKGFLKGRRVNDLMVPGLTQDTLDRWSGATGRKGVKTGTPAYLSADRVAKLDPYRRFKRPASADAEDLLTDEEAEEAETAESVSGPSNIRSLLSTLHSTVDLSQYDRVGHETYVQGLLNVVQTRARTTEDFFEAYKAYREVQAVSSNLYSSRELGGIGSLFDEIIQRFPLRTVEDLTRFRNEVPMGYDRRLHTAYMNKIVEVGMSSNSPGVVDKVIQLANEFRGLESNLYSSRGVVSNWAEILQKLQTKRIGL